MPLLYLSGHPGRYWPSRRPSARPGDPGRRGARRYGAAAALLLVLLTVWHLSQSGSISHRTTCSGVISLRRTSCGACWRSTAFSTRRWAWPIALLTIGFAVLDGATFASGFVRVTPIAEYTDARRLLNGIAYGRVISTCENVLRPDDMTSLGVPTVDGYNSFFFGNYARYGFLAWGNDVPPAFKQNPTFWSDGPVSRHDLLNAVNVTHILTCVPINDDRYVPVRDRNGIQLYQDRQPAERAVWACQGTLAAGAMKLSRCFSKPPAHHFASRSLLPVMAPKTGSGAWTARAAGGVAAWMCV